MRKSSVVDFQVTKLSSRRQALLDILSSSDDEEVKVNIKKTTVVVKLTSTKTVTTKLNETSYSNSDAESEPDNSSSSINAVAVNKSLNESLIIPFDKTKRFLVVDAVLVRKRLRKYHFLNDVIKLTEEDLMINSSPSSSDYHNGLLQLFMYEETTIQALQTYLLLNLGRGDNCKVPTTIMDFLFDITCKLSSNNANASNRKPCLHTLATLNLMNLVQLQKCESAWCPSFPSICNAFIDFGFAASDSICPQDLLSTSYSNGCKDDEEEGKVEDGWINCFRNILLVVEKSFSAYGLQYINLNENNASNALKLLQMSMLLTTDRQFHKSAELLYRTLLDVCLPYYYAQERPSRQQCIRDALTTFVHNNKISLPLLTRIAEATPLSLSNHHTQFLLYFLALIFNRTWSSTSISTPTIEKHIDTTTDTHSTFTTVLSFQTPLLHALTDLVTFIKTLTEQQLKSGLLHTKLEIFYTTLSTLHQILELDSHPDFKSWNTDNGVIIISLCSECLFQLKKKINFNEDALKVMDVIEHIKNVWDMSHHDHSKFFSVKKEKISHSSS